MFFRRKPGRFGGDAVFDRVICGLGNPGANYEDTRHNAGFMAVETLAGKHGGTIKKLKFKSLVGEVNIGGNRVLLMKPQTFMNKSGEAVAEVLAFYKIPYERLIVVFDDISLPVGKIRLRRNGSDGGHNGIKNIILTGNTAEFPRVKIGIGAKPHPDMDLADWVLSRFAKDEGGALAPALENAAAAAEAILLEGIDAAMNRFNNK